MIDALKILEVQNLMRRAKKKRKTKKWNRAKLMQTKKKRHKLKKIPRRWRKKTAHSMFDFFTLFIVGIECNNMSGPYVSL